MTFLLLYQHSTTNRASINKKGNRSDYESLRNEKLKSMLITNSIETYKKLRIEYGVPLFFRIQKRELSRDDEAGATTLPVKGNKLVSFLGVSGTLLFLIR